MPTARDLLAEVQSELGMVAAVTNPWVCPGCLGPKGEPFDWCPGCNRLRSRGCPEEVLRATVPATIAVRPGPWYNRLATYKAGQPRYGLHLVSVFWTFLRSRRDEIERQLGGPVSVITPVPSKRGKSYSEQPLRAALAMAKEIDELLAPVVAYQPDPEVDNLRASYYPQCFRATGEPPSGQRILLVEDTWVSGATTVSAAGSLLEQGAKSVLAVPIARVLDTIYWESSPYVAWIDRRGPVSYETTPWPRST